MHDRTVQQSIEQTQAQWKDACYCDYGLTHAMALEKSVTSIPRDYAERVDAVSWRHQRGSPPSSHDQFESRPAGRPMTRKAERTG